MLQHFCISGRTNLTHTYVCFVMYTDNFHHKFLYHIWYNENPYPLTPYLNTNKQYNISLQNRTDWCVIPVGTALTLLPAARCVEISVRTVIAKPGCYWQLHVSAFRCCLSAVLSLSGVIVIHQLSDSSLAHSVKMFYQFTKFFLIRKLLRVPDISYYRSPRS